MGLSKLLWFGAPLLPQLSAHEACSSLVLLCLQRKTGLSQAQKTLGLSTPVSALFTSVTFLDWTWPDGLTSLLLPHCSVSSHFKLNHGTWSFSAHHPFLPRGLSSRSKISLGITGQPWASGLGGGVVPQSSQYCWTSVSVILELKEKKKKDWDSWLT